MKKIQVNNKEIEYKILNPGGNQTAIVMGNEFDKKERKQINDAILKENTEVEQVGFISTKENKLEMAGGEFCVNATRCAIWQYLEGETGEVQLQVSGFEGKIRGGVTPEKDVYAEMQINQAKKDILEKKRKL